MNIQPLFSDCRPALLPPGGTMMNHTTGILFLSAPLESELRGQRSVMSQRAQVSDRHSTKQHFHSSGGCQHWAKYAV